MHISDIMRFFLKLNFLRGFNYLLVILNDTYASIDELILL